MRALILAAVAALALAGVADAKSAHPVGPYKVDSKGKCRAANGTFVLSSFCTPPTPPPKPKMCRDPKGKFVKCPK